MLLEVKKTNTRYKTGRLHGTHFILVKKQNVIISYIETGGMNVVYGMILLSAKPKRW